MKRITQVTLMALIISAARPAEVQAWSFSELSTSQKTLSITAALTAAFGLYYWWTSGSKAQPTQKATSPQDTNVEFWQGPIPTQTEFNFSSKDATANFILTKVQKLLKSDRQKAEYLSNHRNWEIRLTIEKVLCKPSDWTLGQYQPSEWANQLPGRNQQAATARHNTPTPTPTRHLRVSFAIWNKRGEYTENISVSFDQMITETIQGWKVGENSKQFLRDQCHRSFTCNPTFTNNYNTAVGIFTALCDRVAEFL